MLISYYVVMSVCFYDEIIEEIIKNDEYLFFYFKCKLFVEVFYKDKYDKLFLYYVCENGNVNLFNFYYKLWINFVSFSISLDIYEIILDFVFRSILFFYKNNVIIVNYCNIYFFFVDCDDYRIKILILYEYLVYLILKSLYIVMLNIERYVNISL